MTDQKQQNPRAQPKRGRTMLWVAAAAGLIVGVMAGFYLRDFMAVNAFLDSGGAWTQPGVCVGAPAAP